MMATPKLERQSHGFGPCYGPGSVILILGSFPSLKSREIGFYYSHPSNRFWKLLEAIYGDLAPSTPEGRAEYAIKHGLALYDSIESCHIKGSEDASINKVVPTDLKPIFEACRIKTIILNGKAAEKYFHRYQKPPQGIEVVVLPSTSSANAKYSLDDLTREYGPYLVSSLGAL